MSSSSTSTTVGMPLLPLSLAVLGLLVAGTGLLAAIVPFRTDIEVPPRVDDQPEPLSCDTPLLSPFTDAGSRGGGWFAYAPNTATVLSADSWCTREARTRLSWGAAGIVAGSGLALSQRRRLQS